MVLQNLARMLIPLRHREINPGARLPRFCGEAAALARAKRDRGFDMVDSDRGEVLAQGDAAEGAALAAVVVAVGHVGQGEGGEGEGGGEEERSA